MPLLFIAFVVFTAFAPSDTPVPVLLLESYCSDALTVRCTYRGVLLSVEVIASHCINLHVALVLHEDAVMSAACDCKIVRQAARSLHIACIVQRIHDANQNVLPPGVATAAIWIVCPLLTQNWLLTMRVPGDTFQLKDTASFALSNGLITSSSGYAYSKVS